MIDKLFLAEWRQQVPWPADYQIEQDLIISRALVALYEREKIRESLVFRGGTALNKLFFKPAVRYSEDIDLVQIVAQPIGPLIKEIRTALSWLGQPKGKLTNRSAKLIYYYKSIDGKQRKLKIEINTTEHFSIYDLMIREFSVESSWFQGVAAIKTYQLDELMATKLKALYQRNKGRDLYDNWYVLKHNLINCQAVVDIFRHYCAKEELSVSRAQFEENLFEKKQQPDFRNDILPLITDRSIWSADEAFDLINTKLVQLLPGKPWKYKQPNKSSSQNQLVV